jgi:hypothetical protein
MTNRARTHAHRLALGALALLGMGGCEYLPGLLGAGSGEPGVVVAGSYDAQARYDLSSASGAITQTATGSLAPDARIRDAIVGAFATVHSSAVGDEVAGLYGDYLAGEVRSYMGGAAPWVLDLDQHIMEVDGRLEGLDVKMGVLVVERADGALEVTQIWEGISVLDDPACVDGEACDTLELSTQELLGSEYPVEIASSEILATPAFGGGYVMQDHQIAFNYGRLGLYLLVDAVLPDDGDDTSLDLRDVALAAVNCRGLAQHLTGQDRVLGWNIGGIEVGLSFRDVVGACEEGIFATVNDVVDQFSVPITLDLSGPLAITDEDGDGRIDVISSDAIAGDLSATLPGGAGQDGPVSGVMTGYRVGDLAGTPDPDQNTDIDDGITIFDGEE